MVREDDPSKWFALRVTRPCKARPSAGWNGSLFSRTPQTPTILTSHETRPCFSLPGFKKGDSLADRNIVGASMARWVLCWPVGRLFRLLNNKLRSAKPTFHGPCVRARLPLSLPSRASGLPTSFRRASCRSFASFRHYLHNPRAPKLGSRPFAYGAGPWVLILFQSWPGFPGGPAAYPSASSGP